MQVIINLYCEKYVKFEKPRTTKSGRADHLAGRRIAEDVALVAFGSLPVALAEPAKEDDRV